MIATRLDNDLYNFTMGQLFWEHFPNYRVRYEFKCRTLGLRLGRSLSLVELQEWIDEVRFNLPFRTEDIGYLDSLGYFQAPYLRYLRETQLPEVEIEVDDEGWLHMTYEGDWPVACQWETPLLAIVSELYGRGRFDGPEARARLRGKIDLFKEHPFLPHFMEFGTRRRASSNWHYEALETLLAEIPGHVIGTSNPQMAQHFGIKPKGTAAHQATMVLGAKAVAAELPLWEAEHRICDLWWRMYPKSMRWPLTDTFTTDHFLRHYPRELALEASGFRQDSGDPFAIGAKYLAWYEANQIPKDCQGIVFSDGLDINAQFALARHFEGVSVSTGWGTDLLNDTGYTPPQIVIKPVAVDGLKVVKLSDVLSKANGDPAEIDLYKALARG